MSHILSEVPNCDSSNFVSREIQEQPNCLKFIEPYKTYCPPQEQYNLEAVTPEVGFEDNDGNSQEETSAVDLTIARQPQIQMSSKVFYTHKKGMLSIAELLETFYYNDSRFGTNLASKLLVVNPAKNNIGCLIFDNNSFQNAYQEQQKQNKKLIVAATNNDCVLKIDRESQTSNITTIEKAAQTDLEHNYKAPGPLKKIKNNVLMKYTCSVCQHIYSSKSSYDRHFRNHKKILNKKSVNVHPNTKVKLQDYKTKQQTSVRPIILKVPHSTAYQCGLCTKYFISQTIKDEHHKVCIFEKFPPIKCKECHLTFFTNGAICDHINLAHNKDLAKNAYCCLFCNESFANSYVFQLHLDKHLSP